MRFKQVQRFILAQRIFWGYGHFKLFLDIVFRRVSLARCVDVFVEVLFMLCFFLFSFKTKNYPTPQRWCLYLSYKKRSLGTRYVLMHLETLIRIKIEDKCPLRIEWTNDSKPNTRPKTTQSNKQMVKYRQTFAAQAANAVFKSVIFGARKANKLLITWLPCALVF